MTMGRLTDSWLVNAASLTGPPSVSEGLTATAFDKCPNTWDFKGLTNLHLREFKVKNFQVCFALEVPHLPSRAFSSR
jgi:hypothetical protein